MGRRVVPFSSDLFAPDRKHLFVFAHQDDDLPYSGILNRLADQSQALWVTNGDGLAPGSGMERFDYGQMRTNETIAAMSILGYARSRLHFLGHSELKIYQLLIDLARIPLDRPFTGPVQARIHSLAREIEDGIHQRMKDADVVWTLAWQGGHVEHDMTHYFAVRAARRIEEEQDRVIPIYELPAYEIFFLVPLRFAPWSRGVAHRYQLSPHELSLKQAAFKAYKSQEQITFAFKRLLTLYGALSTLRGKPFGFRKFASEEEFGPVPSDRDYTVSPHSNPAFDYIREEYKSVPVTFPNSLRRLILTLEQP